MYKIKAVGNYVLDVLAVPFGSPSDKDLDGEYFGPETDLHLQQFKDPLILYWHGRDVGGSEQKKAEVIGQALEHKVKPDGLWIKVQLDRASENARRVWDAAKRGLARASSGSVAHLVRRAADGFIADWPLIELSLFDVDHSKNRLPVNKNAIALPAAKALYTQAGRSFPELPTEEYISDAETKALQARAKALLAELEERKWIDSVDVALVKIAFDREPTELERKYEDAGIGAVNFYANTEIKSLPVRILSYMPDAHEEGMVLLGQHDFFGKDESIIILNGNRDAASIWSTFAHELGHAIDRRVKGLDGYRGQGHDKREAAADEYRKMLKFVAWNQACIMFRYGSRKVKSLPVNNLLLALAAHNP